MSSTNNLVYLRWDQLIEQRFGILRSIIENSDKELLAAVVAHDRLSPVDWQATLHNHVQGPSTAADKGQVLNNLRDHLLKTNDQLRDDTKSISDSMDTLANKKDTSTWDWNNLLLQAIGTMKNTALDQLTQMKIFADNEMEGLSHDDRIAVTKIFNQAWIAPTGFQTSMAIYLILAQQNIGNWTREPRKNVKDFQETSKNAFELSRNTIQDAFSSNGLRGPSTLADKDDVLRTLKDILLKTNQLIRQDTNEISQSFEQLANKGGNEEEWVKALDDAEDLMQHKALDQMAEMKRFAINRINSVDGRYRNKVGEIFGHACTALTGFQGSVHLFIKVAKGTADKWYRNPWDNLKIFQRSTKIWYDGAEQGIKRAFPDYLVSDNGRSEDSLSSIQDMATQLQGMGVDNITIIPKGDGWALEIGAGM
ncbi:uncharacterized protein LTHEOB_5990 [Lasiodiplodia theobromae]|uniref:uncharacterized protein n=1 Tax=Lasiodiplodia theobromae TaxID=45133 RepID=UPI0015C31DCA|nr:uncharacterized protein LTHEOB_5990 [Lasiodiplodia theobromae]KAF4544420.1 hypothetical protein LTHEOB_5990 [Lasiodiplodia theobromae]